MAIPYFYAIAIVFKKLPENLPYNDQALLVRIAEGNEEAFKQLFVSYSHLLHPFITKLVKDEQVSEEMIQQVFLKIWLNRDKLQDIDHPKAYIFRMAANECFAFLRRNVMIRKHLDQIEQKETDEPVSNTDSQIAFSEIKKLVNEAFERLPPQQQRIFYLSRQQHLTIPDIAAKLNLSPVTVKNSLVKSLKTMRTHLEKEGYYLPLFLISLNIFWK